jgi:hypothetical protein
MSKASHSTTVLLALGQMDFVGFRKKPLRKWRLRPRIKMKKIIITTLLLFFGLVNGSYAAVIDFTPGAFSSEEKQSSSYRGPAGLAVKAVPALPESNGAILDHDSAEDSSYVINNYEADAIERKEESSALFLNLFKALDEVLSSDSFDETFRD